MKTEKRRVALLILAILSYLLLASGCSRVDESSFFSGHLTGIRDIAEQPMITPASAAVPFCLTSIDDCAVTGDRIVAKEGVAEGLYSVRDYSTGELQGLFCPTDDVPGKPKDGYGLDVRKKGDEFAACFYSPYSRAVYIWNISESLDSGKTVYDRVCQIIYPERDFLSLSVVSAYLLENERVVLANLRQNGLGERLDDLPRFDIFSLTSGEMLTSVEPFILPEMVGLSKFDGVFDFNDCIKPDRSKLAFCMSRMPVLGVIDIESGAVKLLRLRDAPRFNLEDLKVCFNSVTSDDRFIYAMYYGAPLEDLESGPHHSILYVFDWEGRIRGKFGMEGNIVGLVPGDPGEFYLADASEMTMRKVTASELEPFLR